MPRQTTPRLVATSKLNAAGPQKRLCALSPPYEKTTSKNSGFLVCTHDFASSHPV